MKGMKMNVTYDEVCLDETQLEKSERVSSFPPERLMTSFHFCALGYKSRN